MKKIAMLLSIIILGCLAFVGCGSSAPSDEIAANLAKESIDIILHYTNKTPAEALRDDFPDINVTKKTPGNEIPEDMGYITDLEYDEFAEKYGKIFANESLQVFLKFFTVNKDGYLCLTGWELDKSSEVSNIKMEFIKKDGENYIYELTFDKDNIQTMPTPPTDHCNFEVTIVKTDNGFRISENEVIAMFFENAFA